MLDRYKEGKKKLRAIGKVQVGKDAFLHIMKYTKWCNLFNLNIIRLDLTYDQL